MTTPFRVIIPGTPVAKGRPRIVIAAGHVRAYTPGKTAAWEAFAVATLRQAWGDREPLGCPLALEVVALFPRTKALTWKRRPMPRCPHVTSPDADNILKSVQDALTKAGVIRDDALIFGASVSKWYCASNDAASEIPGVSIVLAPAES